MAKSQATLPSRPIVFLDLDDVVCLNHPYGGYDVAQALSDAAELATSADSNAELWKRLFHGPACEYLRQIDEEFHPFYVLTTSWWWLLEDAALREVLRRSGLRFVEENLHPDLSTPKGSKPDERRNEIQAWLDAHPEATNQWVVLDDTLSGTGLGNGLPDEWKPFVVLCSVNIGLTRTEYDQLARALLQRAGPRPAVTD